MSDFKKLSDVEVVVEPIETANVLIEENGVIKKAPKSAVGGAGVVSWNDLADKPFGYNVGNTVYTLTGVVGVDSQVWGDTNINAFALDIMASDYIEAGREYLVILNKEKYQVTAYYGQFTFVGNDSMAFQTYDGTGYPFLFGDSYFWVDPSYSGEINFEVKELIPVLLDEKFIPDTIARVSSVPTSFTWDEILYKPFEETSKNDVLFEGYLEAGSYDEPSVTLLDRPLEAGCIYGIYFKYYKDDGEDGDYWGDGSVETASPFGQGNEAGYIGFESSRGIWIHGNMIFNRRGRQECQIVKCKQIRQIDKKFLPKADAVADAVGVTPSAEEFNALLEALRNAGYLAI